MEQIRQFNHENRHMSSTTHEIFFEALGTGSAPVFWGHGWGQTHGAFLPLAQSLAGMGRHVLVDFPGFGKSPLPPDHHGDVWGTAEYADALAALIRAQGCGPVIWVGHSFGCRVGIQLAARHPELVRGLFLIAAAGLPRVTNPLRRAYFKARIRLYKFLKTLIPHGLPEQWLLKTFASPDYLNAGPLRRIFVKVVNENLAETAAKIACPVVLVYGALDTETPLDIGERYANIIPSAELVVMDGFDHYTVLSEARHAVAHRLNAFINTVMKSA
jgi:pimeloyl-ACP methyl ester carboxylesterase